MKLLVWIVGVPLLLVAAFFAVANRAPVTISLWPLAAPVEVPLFVAIVGALYVGVVVGALAAWWSGRRARKRARREARRADALEREAQNLKMRLDALEAAKLVDAARRDAAQSAPPPSPPAPLLH